MFTPYDWLRRCQTGNEVYATLQLLTAHEYPDDLELGPPCGASFGPCHRCWIYPQQAEDVECIFCASVRQNRRETYELINQSLLVWGYVNQLPWIPQLDQAKRHDFLGYHIIDEKHFLLMISRSHLKAWLQQLVINQGLDMMGLLQVFPTTGKSMKFGMGDILCRAAHQESKYAHDQLRVRFFSSASQLLVPHLRDNLGILTYNITDFIGLMEMAEVFSTVLYPDSREELRLLLTCDDQNERSFYWGRFARKLNQTARDMLESWDIRNWPVPKVEVLYDLLEFMAPSPIF